VVTFHFVYQNVATFAKENHLYNLYMIYFVTENLPKENKSISAQNKMIDITKCLK
jgi:hypothetical protein